MTTQTTPSLLRNYPGLRLFGMAVLCQISLTAFAAEPTPVKPVEAGDTTKESAPPLKAIDVTTTPAPLKDEVIELSPFQVSTNRDVGFVAASSFAGGRMKTDLKDTPLAYSVFTKEFLDTLNIVNPEEAMDWGVNTFQTRGDITDRLNNFDGGTRTRVRGVIVKTLRNFFDAGRINDIYCQDRIDFARGTNALLIGNAGLGGAQVMVTKQAMLNSRKGDLSVTISDQGSRRATLDYNYSVNDKLAVRANLLLEDSQTWRDAERNIRNGTYLTAMFTPWKKTQLRVDFENFKSKEVLALNGLNDRVSGWDGVTVVDVPIGTLPGGVNSNAVGIERLGSSTTQYMLMLPGYNNSTVYNFANNWQTMGGGASTLTPVDGVLATSTSSLGAAGARIFGTENEPVSRFDIATSKSKFFIPTPAYAFFPGSPNFISDRQNYSAYLDQQIGKDFFVNVSANKTVNKSDSNILATRFSEVYVDVNRLLPDGKANPYFLQPYVQTTRDDVIRSWEDIKEWRAAVAYAKDNTKYGTFRFNVFAGQINREGTTKIFTHVIKRNADIRQRPVNDSMGFRYYLLDPNKPYDVPSEVTYVDPVNGTSTTYPVEEMLNLNYTDANNRYGERNFDYVQSSAFAKLFKDRLILLAGKRWDSFHVGVKNMLSNPRTNYPADWDGQTQLYNPDAPANYWSLTASQRGAYNPPDIDMKTSTVTYGGIINATKWLGGFYNYAQTYDTSRVILNINGGLVEPLLSDGWDAGLRLNLLDGRINCSFSKYSTTQIHTLTGVDRFEIFRLAEANVLGDTSQTGRNARGLASPPSPYYDYQDQWAEGYEFEVVANLTKNWRLTMNYALPKNFANNRYPDTKAYLDINIGTLKQIVLDTGAVIDATTQLASNPGIATSLSPDINQAVADWNWVVAFGPAYDANVPIMNTAYKYTANIYTDYKISKGMFKNLRIGAGLNFRSKLAIGNRGTDTIVNPANPLTAIDDPTVDSSTFVYMEAWHMATATLGYEMKLKHNLRLNFNLSVSNLLDREEPIYTATGLRPLNGDVTSPARVTSRVGYYPNPRTFNLTTRLNF